jgi:ankyrin repeat protein
LPAGFAALGDYCLSGCTKLEKLDFIPDSLKRIGRCCFEGTALTTFAIPARLEFLDPAAFDNSPIVSSWNVHLVKFRLQIFKTRAARNIVLPPGFSVKSDTYAWRNFKDIQRNALKAYFTIQHSIDRNIYNLVYNPPFRYWNRLTGVPLTVQVPVGSSSAALIEPMHPVILPATALSLRNHPLFQRVEYVGAESSNSVSRSILVFTEFLDEAACDAQQFFALKDPTKVIPLPKAFSSDCRWTPTQKMIVAIGIDMALQFVIEALGYYPSDFSISNVYIDHNRHPRISFFHSSPSRERRLELSQREIRDLIFPGKGDLSLDDLQSRRGVKQQKVEEFKRWLNSTYDETLVVRCADNSVVSVSINRYIFRKYGRKLCHFCKEFSVSSIIDFVDRCQSGRFQISGPNVRDLFYIAKSFEFDRRFLLNSLLANLKFAFHCGQDYSQYIQILADDWPEHNEADLRALPFSLLFHLVDRLAVQQRLSAKLFRFCQHEETSLMFLFPHSRDDQDRCQWQHIKDLQSAFLKLGDASDFDAFIVEWGHERPGFTLFDFVCQVEFAFRNRPKNINLYCDLLACMAGPVVKDAIAQWIGSKFHVLDFPRERPDILYFINQLLSRGIVEPGAVSVLVANMRITYCNTEITRDICRLYFAPEISIAELPAPDPRIPGVSRSWVARREYILDDWKVWRQLRANLWFDDLLVKSLIEDDLECFCTVVRHVDQRIEPCVFLPWCDLQYRPPVVCAAAFFGAVRCFRELLMRNAELSLQDDRHYSIAQFAVAGNHIGILRELEHRAIDLVGAYHIAAGFAHYDLLDYLVARSGKDRRRLMNEVGSGTFLAHAAKKNNIFLIELCFHERLDVNRMSLDASFPLLQAVESGHLEATAMLVAHPDIEPGPREPGGINIFERAAEMGDGRILDVLLRSGKAAISCNLLGRCCRSAMRQSASECLFVLDRFCPGFPREVLLEVLAKRPRQELWLLTHDCLDFFWERISNEERALFVLANLVEGNSFPVKWAVKHRRAEAMLNQEVRGMGYPLFCAIEAGLPAVRILLELDQWVDFNVSRVVDGAKQSALEFAARLGEQEIVDLLKPRFRGR